MKILLPRLVAGYRNEDDAMKKQTKPKRPSAGSRIIASLQEAADWVEGRGRAGDDGGGARDRREVDAAPARAESSGREDILGLYSNIGGCWR